MAFLLGIDFGTSSLKTMLINEFGKQIAISSQGYTLDVPQQGFAEQDPEVWWHATIKTIKKVIYEAEINPENISGIGLSGQMHGLVPIDKNSNVIRKAILHCDQRSAKQVQKIKRLIPDNDFYNITYNPIFPGFQLLSLIWMRDNEPEKYEQIYKVLCPKDYIRFKLTGEIGTEITDASGTLVFDIKKQKWSDYILNKLEINKNIFPKDINYSYDVAGTVCAEAKKEIGLSTKTLVVFGGGDQPMQSLGNGVYRPGTITSTIGTSGQILAVSNKPISNPECNTHVFCHVKPNTWYGLGAVLSAGLSLKWLKNTFKTKTSYNELVNHKVEKIPPGCEGLVFLPSIVGERTPYMDSEAKGIFFGISSSHTFEHFVRAVLEGVCFSLKTSLNILEKIGHKTNMIIASGGATKSSLWLQIQSDILGRKLLTTKTVEHASMGAAITAGVGCGLFDNIEEACDSIIQFKSEVIMPQKDNFKKYNYLYNEVYKKLYPNNFELFPKLNEIAGK